MRRHDRYLVKGAVIAAGATMLADILIQCLEQTEQGKRLALQNIDGLRIMRSGLYGGVCGAGIGQLLYEMELEAEALLPFNSDEYLTRLLTEESLRADNALLTCVLNYRKELISWLQRRFQNKLISQPENTGSFFKRTAIQSKYDIDILLPFARNSFPTLKDMYYEVYEILERSFGEKAIVRKQTKAIALAVNVGNQEVNFDIVPGREINDYRLDRDLNLYVRPDWVWQRGSSFKTNVDLQKSITVNNPAARRIIKLIKIYSYRNNLRLPTIIIEHCVVRGLSPYNHGVHYSVTENLLNCMDYTANKLVQKTIIDDANSNNNLGNKISNYRKSFIADHLLNDIKRIENNPRFIKEIFDC